MALQINFTDPATKIVAPTCYGKILYMNIDALNSIVDISVGLYATAAARAAGGTPLTTMHFWPPINQVATVPIPVDIQTSLYTYLKTQPVFAGALDV